MKVCITASGNNLKSSLDPRFGRCLYFLIVDGKGKLLKAVENTGVRAMRGAGISAGQIMAQEKVDAVITGNVGPNAFMVLDASGIEAFLSPTSMTVKQAFKAYKKGELEKAKTAVPCQGGFGRGFGRRGGR